VREAAFVRGGSAWEAALERGGSGGAQKSASCAHPDKGETEDQFSLGSVSHRHRHGNFRWKGSGVIRE
jgi:hypothetical protein